MEPQSDLTQFNDKTVLVFGGDGFIGSNFIRNLFNASPRVKIINGDKRTYSGNPNNLADIRARYQSSENDTGQLYELHGGVEDPEFVKACFGSEPDYVINFAAETHVDRSIHVGSKEFVDTNVTGVMNILEELKKHAKVQRFVQVSTDEVYGQLPNPYDLLKEAEELGPDHYKLGGAELNYNQLMRYGREQKFTEESPFKPNVPYSATKAGGDCLANAYFHTWHVPVCITHCSNNYGPYQYPEKLVPFWASRVIRGEKVPIYGDGLNIRDWIHVDDHITALAAVLRRGEPGETYNIGADNELTNLDMMHRIVSILRPHANHEDCYEFVVDRPGHDRRYAIDHSKITKELGWKPQYGAAEFLGKLRETLEWYRDNSAWIDEVVQRTGVANPHIDLWKAHDLKTS